MTAAHCRGRSVRAFWKALRSQTGAFDLPSILVGVVVVGILTAGVLAAVFGVIPFAQDNAAKQDLDSVRTAEGVAKSRLNGFKDKPGLLSGGLMTDADTLAVGTNTDASCYVGISKSATGTVFYNSDKTTKPEILTPTTDTGCVDAAARDSLVDEVGGYGPTTPVGGSNDTDGDGIPNSEDPTPNGDGTGATYTDGDGIPDAEDPTPNGGGSDPDALPAGFSWSSRAIATNSIKDPSFALGSTGWSTPLPSSVATVGHAPGMGIDGGAAVRLTTSGTVGDGQGNYGYYTLPSKAGGNEFVNIKVSSNMPGVQPVYGSIVTVSATGAFLHETSAVTSYVGAANGWKLARLGTTPWHAAANPAAGFTRYLKIRMGESYNDPALENYQIYLDQVALLTGSQDYFDGQTASSGEYSYRYAGALHDSVSEKLTTKQIATPSVITLGQDFTVTGRGFPANTELKVREYEEYYGEITVTTDGSGSFSATMNIPVGPPIGPGQLEVFSGWGAQYVTKDVTFQ